MVASTDAHVQNDRLETENGRLHELANAGEVDHVRVSRRAYIRRASLTEFVQENTRSGYQAEYAR